MSRYAENTTVPVDRSRAEIERNLIRFGASGFSYAWEGDLEAVAFLYAGKHVRMSLPMPRVDSAGRRGRKPGDAKERERKRRWRSLAMVVKALLVGVSDGIITFEEAFLAHFVTPDGRTLGEAIVPRLEAAAAEGQLPPLMLPAGRRALTAQGGSTDAR